jgi:hypothetical protein
MSEEVMSTSEQKKEDWMNTKWRPMMGWMYMAVCTCDFILFPVLWSVLHASLHTANMSQWNPLTLQGAGLFHIAMGAVLGIAAFGRTQEKLSGAERGGMQPLAQSVTTTFGAPTGGFSSPAQSTSFTPAPSWGTTPTSAAPKPAVTNSKGPAPAAEPEL